MRSPIIHADRVKDNWDAKMAALDSVILATVLPGARSFTCRRMNVSDALPRPGVSTAILFPDNDVSGMRVSCLSHFKWLEEDTPSVHEV